MNKGLRPRRLPGEAVAQHNLRRAASRQAAIATAPQAKGTSPTG